MNKTLITLGIALLTLSACNSAPVDEAMDGEENGEAMMESDAMMEENGDAIMEGDAMMESENKTEAPAAESSKTEADAPAKTETKTEVEVEVEAEASAPVGQTVAMVSGNLFFRPNAVTAKVNQPLTITFTNTGFHTFTIDALGVDVDLRNKPTGSVTFTPTKTGSFEFYCAIPGHRAAGMVGTLTVTE
ncbi:hypothetical protein CO046_02365 [Candidatus Peregrinibacteria bacterium CG_4_9_14_0_2_um_filter_53_11]|nr:MAG: hypothetical protein CO046_02365 [Candidatus Peregrinibacteria bacterium CG_4_9_14_0_2_um_filter_53_11]